MGGAQKVTGILFLPGKARRDMMMHEPGNLPYVWYRKHFPDHEELIVPFRQADACPALAQRTHSGFGMGFLFGDLPIAFSVAIIFSGGERSYEN